MVPLDPTEQNLSEDDQAKVNLFMETFDAVTSDFDAQYSDSAVADAMIEAAFRTMAVVSDPSSELWRDNELTFTKTSFTIPATLNRTKIGAPKFTPYRAGDKINTSTDTITIVLDTH